MALQNGKPSVLIIGSGAAGIAAASRLLKNGIEDVTVLEAEDRIGGRIFSVEFGKNYVDLGAEWCHGEEDNIVYDLVKDLNLIHPAPKRFPKVYHSKIKNVDQNFTEELFYLYESIYLESKTGANCSLGNYLEKRYNEAIQVWKDDQEKFLLASDFIGYYNKWMLSHEGSFSLYNITADYDYIECPGHQRLFWNGLGFKAILDVLMGSSQRFPIVLNKEVNQISWDADVNKVSCTDTTTYVADHVIFTPSLGVLKEQHVTLFKPPLPNEKVEAIQNLGFDSSFKVFMHFSKRWWDDNFLGYIFVWDKHDLDVKNFPSRFQQDGKTWLTSTVYVTAVEENFSVLQVWFAGDAVPTIEKVSDETLVDGIMYIFSEFSVCKKEELVRPVEIIRHNWHSNPHFRGTYSYQSLKSKTGTNSDEVALSRPLISSTGRKSVLFAGEATDPCYYSTVHGAIRSGFREADRIISIYKSSE